ncbi:MAG: A/G-specific adenine glycosylase [Candidatus Marinimicrobia bacterium]|nr:A/G-specific adenine glycosylase [Candidatus Neomarinimicrobiota bacterium]
MHYTNKSKAILNWYDCRKRNLPWRSSKNPYKVWLSEVMLQQTQVETVIPYYENWLNNYPTILSVANADLDDLLKIWEGLGYYTRCRNFYRAAREVVSKFNCKIPDQIDRFRTLPGVGDYIAGAVMSIAFNQSHVAIDGNHRRVISRVLGLKSLSRYNQKRLKSYLRKLIAINRPGDMNQALMDIGSSICKPRSTCCIECPLHNSCRAYLSGKPLSYPDKISGKRIPVKNIVAALFEREDKILISKRPERGLLGGLWELPNTEIPNGSNPQESLKNILNKKNSHNIKVGENVGEIKHTFTHFKMNVSLYHCKVSNYSVSEPMSKWVSFSDLNQYAFSKANHKLFGLIKKENV